MSCNAVILAAHGKLAEGVQSGLHLIVGDMPNLRVVNFQEKDTFETIDQALSEAFDTLSEYKNVLFITDLQGGTPFNRSVIRFAENQNVRVLSGLNFALTYQALISETEDIDAYVAEVIEAGKDSIQVYQTSRCSLQDDESDGI